MARYVLTAADAFGAELGQRVMSTAPALADVAELGDLHDACFVTARRQGTTTLYERDSGGSWSVIETDIDDELAAEAMLWVGATNHYAGHHHVRPAAEPRPRRDGESQPTKATTRAASRGPSYVLSATDVEGHMFGHRICAEPSLAEAAELGDLHEANYVLATYGDEVALYGRDARGFWRGLTADVDAETAAEVCLWFDLTQHYHGRSPAVGGHPLAQLPPPAEGGRMDAARAISLIVAHIRSRDLDYPTQGLEAERFDAGWRVYAPVDVDESDPMKFLEIPVGRSVFLVGDGGRIKETTTSSPPRQANELFAAEETFVRRPSSGRERAKAAALVNPIAQQLALLGPPEWDRYTAVFSYTVSAEIARLRFWSGGRAHTVPVPEQLALLVRRQRHLAARTPTGAWWRLLIVGIDHADQGVEFASYHDYGHMPFPDDQLLAAEHYRADVIAYPRPRDSLSSRSSLRVPAWLAEYLDGREVSTTPRTPRSSELDTTVNQRRLHGDAEVIAYGPALIAVHEADHVRHWISPPFSDRRLARRPRERTWHFEVDGGLGAVVALEFTTHDKDTQSGYWSALVGWSKRYLEPRLVAALAARVRSGETVQVAGLWVHARGCSTEGMRQSLTWQSITGVQIADGNVCVYQVGKVKPAIAIPLDQPNAVLIPDLFAALKP